MGEEAINAVVKAGTSGIPHLYEWGGLVTLLTLIVIAAFFAVFGLCWVIWQMYQQNQKMFAESIQATNRGSTAIENLTEWVKGSKQGG